LGDADRVLEPLAGLEVVDDGAGGVAHGSDDVDVGVGAVEAALVTAGEVVPRDAFPAVVEVLRLDEPGNGEWDSLVRGASGSRWLARRREASPLLTPSARRSVRKWPRLAASCRSTPSRSPARSSPCCRPHRRPER